MNNKFSTQVIGIEVYRCILVTKFGHNSNELKINNVKVINIIFNDFCIIATIKKLLLRVVF